MKAISLPLFLALVSFSAQGQTRAKAAMPDPSKKVKVVEAACGECQFGMDGKSCDLTVKIDGKPYFVDGTSIDEHGDAHAANGFCNIVRKAEVQGEVVNGRFHASYFRLLDDKKKKISKKINRFSAENLYSERLNGRFLFHRCFET